MHALPQSSRTLPRRLLKIAEVVSGKKSSTCQSNYLQHASQPACQAARRPSSKPISYPAIWGTPHRHVLFSEIGNSIFSVCFFRRKLNSYTCACFFIFAATWHLASHAANTCACSWRSQFCGSSATTPTSSPDRTRALPLLLLQKQGGHLVWLRL